MDVMPIHAQQPVRGVHRFLSLRQVERERLMDGIPQLGVARLQANQEVH